MPLSFQISGSEKDQLVVSLAALLLHDCGADLSSENIDSVVQASNNKVPAYFPSLFAGFIDKAGGVEKFLTGPSAGAGRHHHSWNVARYN
jgi:large subunit ribosomal protein LP1